MTPERKQKINTVLSYKQSNLCIVLDNVHDPHNIQAILRTCDAVGISEIYTIKNNGRIKNDYFIITKSSSSANKWIPVNAFDDYSACVKAIRTKYDKIYATHLTAQSVDIYEMDFTQNMALVFGNEKDGVSDDLLKLCDGNFIIPQYGMIQSLNISVACAITLFEAYRQKKIAGHYNQANLPDATRNALLSFWDIKANDLL